MSPTPLSGPRITAAELVDYLRETAEQMQDLARRIEAAYEARKEDPRE